MYLCGPMQTDHAVANPPPETEPVLETPAHVRMRLRAGDEARRVRLGLRRPANWFQLVRFTIVGGTGYVVNLGVFSALVEVLGVHYIPAAIVAFCAAVTNNFLLSRHWTFKATHGRVTLQAARFLLVS